MRVFRLAASDKPRIASEVRILAHQVQRAVLCVLPQRLIETKRDLLDGAVLTVRRTCVSVPDTATIGIYGHIPADVNAAVVAVYHGVLVGELETRNRGSGVNQRQASVSTCDQVRRLAENIAAAATAVVIVGEQPETFQHLKVQVCETTATHCRIVIIVVRIPDPEIALYSADLNVKLARRIESELGDHIGKGLRSVESSGLVVQLAPGISSGESCRKGDRSAAGRTADVLFLVVECHCERNLMEGW